MFDGRAGASGGYSLDGLRAALARRGFARADDTVLTGTASGLAAGLGVDPAVVRVAFSILALAGGAGVLLYALAWLALGSPDPRVMARAKRFEVRRIAGVAFVTGGVLVLLRATGWWFGDTIVWSAALAGLGAVIVWGRSGTLPVRVFAGALLVGAAAYTVLRGNIDLAQARVAALPVAVTMGGLIVILGPWLARLGAQVSRERQDRIRSEERAEVAAHLHDSVLQTLALIQRGDNPRRMSTLARLQERDLRAWLYGRTGEGSDKRSLSAAVDELAARVEVMFDVEVEAVVVGEGDLDERAMALLGAAGEAMTNAARHSGAEKVSVYVEIDATMITVYVSDRGKGFDPCAETDGRGIRESIRSRMERNGGTVEVISAPDEGAEVQLRMQRV